MTRFGRLLLATRLVFAGLFGFGALVASTALSFVHQPIAQAVAWSLLLASVMVLGLAAVLLRRPLAPGWLD